MVSGERQAASSKPHVKLEAWKTAMDLVEEVYRIAGTFPTAEQFGLISQMRRAAVSIPSNLAEGAARESAREFAQFLSIAKGSISELDTQHQIAVRLGFMDSAESAVLMKLIERTSKLVTGLHRKVKEDA